jgi:hypothetical protein
MEAPRRNIIHAWSSSSSVVSESSMDSRKNHRKSSRSSRSFKCGKTTVIWFLCLLFLLLLLLVFGRYPSSHHLYQDTNHNNLNKKPPETIGACQGLTYTSPPVQHRPIWIASYTGSGAEMVRDLVQALTGGLVGGSVYTKRDPPFMDCITSQAATCKTHWPILPVHSPLLVTHAIVLVRNPIHAFASRLNHLYLWEVKTETGEHTRQALERAWNQWIQKHWKHQLEKYHELIHTWTNTSFPYKVELILAYEDLIQATTTTSTTDSSRSNNSNSNGSRPLGALAAQRVSMETDGGTKTKEKTSQTCVYSRLHSTTTGSYSEQDGNRSLATTAGSAATTATTTPKSCGARVDSHLSTIQR